MASIENRSRCVVSVQNRDDLTKTFAFNREAALKQYIADLKAQLYLLGLWVGRSSRQCSMAEVRGRADLCNRSLSFGKSETVCLKRAPEALQLKFRNDRLCHPATDPARRVGGPHVKAGERPGLGASGQGPGRARWPPGPHAHGAAQGAPMGPRGGLIKRLGQLRQPDGSDRRPEAMRRSP